MQVAQTRRQVRESLKTLGQVRQAEDMRHRAGLLREAAQNLSGESRETTLQMAKTLSRSAGKILREAGKISARLSALSPAEQRIIMLKYVERKSWQQVCTEVHYSRAQAARIEQQAVDKLRKAKDSA